MDLADRKFRRALFVLRQQCHTSLGLPVQVRRMKDLENYGSSYLRRDGKAFEIFISTMIRDEITRKPRKTTYCEMVDALIHEWAHAMSWTPENHPSVTDHDAAWGVAYAKAYSAVIGDLT